MTASQPTSERLFKVTGEDGRAYHGGSGKWPLPTDSGPGEWLTVTGTLIPCSRGLHLCRASDLVYWLGPVIWEVEYEGERSDAEDKVVVRKAHLIRRVEAWNDRAARLFAADCAEHVLPIFEKQHPDDRRPRAAIDVARRYANGTATAAELAAAWDAADGVGAARAARAAGVAERAWQTDQLLAVLGLEVQA